MIITIYNYYHGGTDPELLPHAVEVLNRREGMCDLVIDHVDRIYHIGDGVSIHFDHANDEVLHVDSMDFTTLEVIPCV